MANGGIFSVATGRAKPAFETVVDGVPMNGPTVLFNGAAIYDFPRKKYLVTAFLPDSVRQHVTEVVTALPQVAVELYHDDNTIHALNANDVTPPSYAHHPRTVHRGRHHGRRAVPHQ